MRINSGVNIQSNNYNNVRGHIERKFEDKNLSERNWDSNLGINWKLSQFNKGTDGKIIYNKNNPNHPYHFKFNKREFNHLKRLKNQMIIQHVMPYVKQFNSSKSCQINPKRKITEPLKLFSPNNERTTVDSFGTSTETGLQTNYDNIKLIERHYNKGYKNAYVRYIKAVSTGLENYEKGFNKRYKYVKKFNHFSNVDETTGQTKPSRKPDALHDHSSIIGFAWSKYDKNGNPITKKYQTRDKYGKIHNRRAGKPSFDVPRALCHEFNIKYSKKNTNKALSIFRKRESKEIVKNVQHVLEQRFSKVPEFKSITYTPTKAQQTGLSHKQFKRLMDYKDKAKKTVANRNRDRARWLIRETRKLEYKKAHRKRARRRARKAVMRERRANSKVNDYIRMCSSLEDAGEIYSANNKSYSSANVSLSAEVASKSTKVSNFNNSLSSLSPQISSASTTMSSFATVISSQSQKASNFSSMASANASTASVTANLLSEYYPINRGKRKMNKAEYQSVAVNGVNLARNGKKVGYFQANDLITIGINKLSASASDTDSTARKADSKASSLSSANTDLESENKKLLSENHKFLNNLKNEAKNYYNRVRKNIYKWIKKTVDYKLYEARQKYDERQLAQKLNKFDLSRSKYWSGYVANNVAVNEPEDHRDPLEKPNLKPLLHYAVTTYYYDHGNNFKRNKLERKIIILVGGNPNDPNAYTKPWYELGRDTPLNPPQDD